MTEDERMLRCLIDDAYIRDLSCASLHLRAWTLHNATRVLYSSPLWMSIRSSPVILACWIA